MNTLSRLVLLSIMAVILGACSGSDTTEPGPPSAADEFALTIIARTASGAPEDYGIVPGNVVVGAKVSVGNIEFPDTEAAGGITDESGRLVIMVRNGTYDVRVERETHDPYCTWYGSTEVEVKNKSTKVSVDNLWVLCE